MKLIPTEHISWTSHGDSAKPDVGRANSDSTLIAATPLHSDAADSIIGGKMCDLSFLNWISALAMERLVQLQELDSCSCASSR